MSNSRKTVSPHKAAPKPAPAWNVHEALEGISGKVIASAITTIGFIITAVTTKLPSIFLALAIFLAVVLALCFRSWHRNSSTLWSIKPAITIVVVLCLSGLSIVGYFSAKSQEDAASTKQQLSAVCARVADMNASLLVGLRYADAHQNVFGLANEVYQPVTQSVSALTEAADSTLNAQFMSAARNVRADIDATADILPPNPVFFTNMMALNTDIVRIENLCSAKGLNPGTISQSEAGSNNIISTKATEPQLCDQMRAVNQLMAKGARVDSADGRKITNHILDIMYETVSSTSQFKISSLVFAIKILLDAEGKVDSADTFDNDLVTFRCQAIGHGFYPADSKLTQISKRIYFLPLNGPQRSKILPPP